MEKDAGGEEDCASDGGLLTLSLLELGYDPQDLCEFFIVLRSGAIRPQHVCAL